MNELLTMLDTKYKRLEYIQSTGTQWIDTGYVPTLNTKIRVKFSPTVVSNVGYFGARKEPYRFCCTTFSTGTKFAFSISNNTWSNNKTDLVLGQIYDCIAYNGKQIINGIEYDEPIVENWGDCGTVKLSQVQGDFLNNSSAKYYSCQIWENDILVRNLIPVLRKSDNEIGMLDLIEGKFYGNAGTGKFTANLDTMYAIIQGTPTVQDGRVSGFSTSNYLKLDRILNVDNKTWEYQIKFRLNQINVHQTLGQRLIIGVVIGLENKCRYYATDGSVFNGDYGSHILSLNQDYYLKIVYNGSSYTSYISTDGKTWEIDITSGTTSTVISSPSDYGIIGFNSSTNYYLHGTIDLNRSYIKIDDTKYKLQAVVGYTKVGSPTITDGVVSGFSNSNYLQISREFSNLNSFEIVCKFNLSTLSRNNTIFSSSAYQFVLRISDNNKITFLATSSTTWDIANINGTTVLSTNIDYWVKLIFTGTQYIVYLSLDGKNYSTEITVNSSLKIQTMPYIMIGRRGSANEQQFDGTIDLNESYIKINDTKYQFRLPSGSETTASNP